MSRIMITGAAVADVLVCPADEKVFQTGSQAVNTIRMSTGGDALNEASVLAKLGEKPELCTILGDDRIGAFLEEYCRSQGISLTYTKKVPDMETGLNVVLVQKNGERSFLTNPNSTLRQLNKEHIVQPFPEGLQILCLASMFVSPHLGNRELAGIFGAAKKQQICVCADMTKCKNQETVQDMREAFSQVDYLFANKEEAGLVTGKERLQDMADAFLACGTGCVVIKCGREGCFVKNRETAFCVPGFCVPCVDTTGAGDSFAAGFLYGLLNGKDLHTCALYGNACGALAVQQVGACEGGISLPQVDALVKSYRKNR